MANTYTQLGVHIVTAVKHRRAAIDPTWRPRLEAFVRTIIEARKHHVLALFLMPDHVHVLVAMHPGDSVSALVGSWKAQTSGFVRRTFGVDFEFQRGYSALAVSKRRWPAVAQYIRNQEAHHADETLRAEYERLLAEHNVDYDARYVLDKEPVG